MPTPTLWVPIIHPRWSGSMQVLVDGAAEPLPSADIMLDSKTRSHTVSWGFSASAMKIRCR